MLIIHNACREGHTFLLFGLYCLIPIGFGKKNIFMLMHQAEHAAAINRLQSEGQTNGRTVRKIVTAVRVMLCTVKFVIDARVVHIFYILVYSQSCCLTYTIHTACVLLSRECTTLCSALIVALCPMYLLHVTIIWPSVILERAGIYGINRILQLGFNFSLYCICRLNNVSFRLACRCRK